MKKLLFIDPHFALRSPSLKSTLREFPACFEDFDEVEVWAVESSFEDPKLRLDAIWSPFKVWNVVSIWFWLRVHGRFIWRYFVLSQPRPQVVQATNYYCYWADVVYFHFSFLAYARVIARHKGIFRMGWLRKMIFWLHYGQEWILFKCAPPKRWWVVSRTLMEETRAEASPGSQFRVLPNSYDGGRFNATVRSSNRLAMRERLGLKESDAVFVFVSLGDLKRKGLDLALRAVGLLWEKKLPARLLVVGGPTAEPMDLQPYLAENGIVDGGFLKVVGQVPDIEKYLAAADGLLFPSYCEAFALVEIEAAAMGLRMYLTPHYGSEMILRPPGNGAFIPWEAVGIAEVLEAEMASGVLTRSTGDMGEALDREGFLKSLRLLYQEALSAGLPGVPERPAAG